MISKKHVQWHSATSEYPAFSMLLVMVLILLSLFTTVYLCYVAFIICIIRIIRYDEKVFATDYCMLIPVTPIFRLSDGMTFLIWMCLIGSIWYMSRNRIRGDGGMVCLILMLNYLIMRMQMDVHNFILCFGQMFVLYALLPKQDAQSAARSLKAFCCSLVATSIFAILVRNTPQLAAIRGKETVAIWGTNIMRFCGLFRDPNFYMTLLMVGLALLCKLKEIGEIKGFVFWVLAVSLTAFGILTYSKTFFLALILLIGLYIFWHFWDKKVIYGVFMILVGIVSARYLLFAEDSPFAIVLARLTSANNISELTTGRTDVYAQYLTAIFNNVGTFLFGYGLGASGLLKDPHNVLIELTYYTGVFGLILYVSFCIIMFKTMDDKRVRVRQNLVSKYVLVIMMLVLYAPLNGIFTTIFYSELFLTFMAVLLTKKDCLKTES